MVYIDTPLLAVFFAGIAIKLAATSYNKLTPKLMGPFTIVGFQTYPLTIDESGNQNTVPFDRATMAPGNNPHTDASQCFEN